MYGNLFTLLQILTYAFVFVVGSAALIVIILFFRDISQTENAIRRNFPVIGRFRSLFEKLGEFFRQYFFAQDREEMPFNRAERNWTYRAAANVDNTSAFGSTRDLHPSGSVIFVNCPFPTLDVDAAEPAPVIIGPTCRQPYTTASLFNISAMSYGSISRPAVTALSKGAKHAGCWLNTGEGGLSPHHFEGGCDLVFQIGTAKYGVRDSEGKLSDERLRDVAAHDQVRMFELKLSQGAKPGKGGILPAAKVTPEIANIRGIPVFHDSISPNRHPEINTISDLLDMIEHIRAVTGKPTGFKAVIGAYGWLDELCREIDRRGIEQAPDFITVDSGDGGTGAAPMSLMDNVGMPLRESMPLVIDKLNEYDLRERIKVIGSGKLINPTEVAWALAMGADFVNSARGFMFALGCIQAMRCNKDTCPTGITTHNPKLQSGLDPENKAVRVANYARNMVREVGIIAHACGVAEPRRLRRYHARIITETGRSVSAAELFPDAAPRIASKASPAHS